MQDIWRVCVIGFSCFCECLCKIFCKHFLALKFLCKTCWKETVFTYFVFLESFDLPEIVCLLRLNIANLNMDYLPLTILEETLGHWFPYYESQHTNKNTNTSSIASQLSACNELFNHLLSIKCKQFQSKVDPKNM